MKVVYLGLGSNLGDRRANLESAIRRLDLKVTRASSLYETEPRDVPNQPWFLNQVIEIETDLFPRQLLLRIRKVERELGRKPSVPKGPRIIDIDILFWGSSTIRSEELEVPHPRLAERRFVLEPLAELIPDFRHPVTNQSVREMLQKVSTQAVKRLND